MTSFVSGQRVRLYDFPDLADFRTTEGPRANFIEGVVHGTDVVLNEKTDDSGTTRYALKATRVVVEGVMVSIDEAKEKGRLDENGYVYPPIGSEGRAVVAL